MAFYITMFVVWSLVFIIALVIEINTIEQIGTAAMIASVVSVIVHVFKSEQYWPEIIAFVVTWVISWCVLFAIFGKIRKNLHDSSDGYLDFINKEYIATKGNENVFGSVSINNKIIRFKSVDKISKGDRVFANSLRGVTLNVVAINKKEGK